MSAMQTLSDTKIANNVCNADIICQINENIAIMSAVQTLSDTKIANNVCNADIISKSMKI